MSEVLTEAVYAQLRAIAQRQMRAERAGHTLQATALVHEAYLRLSRREKSWSGEAEFYSAAAEAMRRILIEHARKRHAAKRGGASGPTLSGGMLAITDIASLAMQDDPDLILTLDEAILRLREEEPRAAEVVRLRFYAGLTVEQAAQTLGLSRATVMRDWEYARAWLAEALGAEPGGRGR